MITDKTILVGGQAVSIWGTLYDIPIPDDALTGDIDFVASREDAELASKNINEKHELLIPENFDPTVNSAVIAIKVDWRDQPVVIDYLLSLYGMDRRKIDDGAVLIEIDGIAMRILHPFILLESKVRNLELRSKQNAAGVAQAMVAVKIMNAFIANVIDDGHAPRYILNLTRKVLDFAKSKAAIEAYSKYGVDVMDAIPIDRFESSSKAALKRFHEKGWPTDIAQVRHFRGI